nr:ulp1 protease family, C-terminal catalytic domain-containing protein [Tanacetum cinerariifolium]
EPNSCFLFSPYTEDMTPIARGMVYPIGDGTIHGGLLIPYYMKGAMQNVAVKKRQPLQTLSAGTDLEQANRNRSSNISRNRSSNISRNRSRTTSAGTDLVQAAGTDLVQAARTDLVQAVRTDLVQAAGTNLVQASATDLDSPSVNRSRPGSESRPPMLNKENYVPWSSRLLRYAKSRPNENLIHNSILNGPYVRKMVPEPGDANRDITVTKTFHLQTDDELSDKELKQIEADDQAIQTILFRLLEDIYAAVDSCETAQEIWLRVQQMMKGSDIGIQENKAKLFNEWERVQNVGNQNGLIGVQGNGNQNQIGNGNLVVARAEGNATGQNGNQIRCYNCRGVVITLGTAQLGQGEGMLLIFRHSY